MSSGPRPDAHSHHCWSSSCRTGADRPHCVSNRQEEEPCWLSDHLNEPLHLTWAWETEWWGDEPEGVSEQMLDCGLEHDWMEAVVTLWRVHVFAYRMWPPGYLIFLILPLWDDDDDDKKPKICFTLHGARLDEDLRNSWVFTQSRMEAVWIYCGKFMLAVCL